MIKNDSPTCEMHRIWLNHAYLINKITEAIRKLTIAVSSQSERVLAYNLHLATGVTSHANYFLQCRHCMLTIYLPVHYRVERTTSLQNDKKQNKHRLRSVIKNVDLVYLLTGRWAVLATDKTRNPRSKCWRNMQWKSFLEIIYSYDGFLVFHQKIAYQLLDDKLQKIWKDTNLFIFLF